MYVWTHLVAQDSLLDQPGIAIQPHSRVTAAPHPPRSLHTQQVMSEQVNSTEVSLICTSVNTII